MWPTQSPAACDPATNPSTKWRQTDEGGKQEANPDISSADVQLSTHQPVCILPGICRAAEYGPSPNVAE